ncbi:MAG: hypothetical protein WBF78_16250, partial [Vibrio anguillarum]
LTQTDRILDQLDIIISSLKIKLEAVHVFVIAHKGRQNSMVHLTHLYHVSQRVDYSSLWN